MKEVIKALVMSRISEMFNEYFFNYGMAIENPKDFFAFIDIIQKNDEYSEAVINEIHDKFQKEVMTEEKIKEITLEEMRKFSSVIL